MERHGQIGGEREADNQRSWRHSSSAVEKHQVEDIWEPSGSKEPQNYIIQPKILLRSAETHQMPLTEGLSFAKRECPSRKSFPGVEANWEFFSIGMRLLQFCSSLSLLLVFILAMTEEAVVVKAFINVGGGNSSIGPMCGNTTLPCVSLRDASMACNAQLLQLPSGSRCEFQLAPGIYTGLNNTALALNHTVGGLIGQAGKKTETILDGADLYAGLSASSTSITLSSLTFRHFLGSAFRWVAMESSVLNVSACSFESNGIKGSSQGGGLSLDTLGDNIHVFIDESRFYRNQGLNGGAVALHAFNKLYVFFSITGKTVLEENVALAQNNFGGLGGAMYVEGGGSFGLELYLGNDTILLRNAASALGGAVYFDVSAAFKALLSMGSGCEFLHNSAGKSGGAVYGIQGGAAGEFKLNVGDFATYLGNNATGFYILDGGGAIYLECVHSCELNIGHNTQFLSNHAPGNGFNTGYGGALMFLTRKGHSEISKQRVTLTVCHSVLFAGNSAHLGGAIYLDIHSVNVQLYLTNAVTFTSNTAEYAGGGMYLTLAAPGTLFLESENVHFSGNHAGRSGGGIFAQCSGASLRLQSSTGFTFDGNWAGHNAADICLRAEVSSNIIVAQQEWVSSQRGIMADISAMDNSKISLALVRVHLEFCAECIRVSAFLGSSVDVGISVADFQKITSKAFSLLSFSSSDLSFILSEGSFSHLTGSITGFMTASAAENAHLVISLDNVDVRDFTGSPVLQLLIQSFSVLQFTMQNSNLSNNAMTFGTGGVIGASCQASYCTIGLKNVRFDGNSAHEAVSNGAAINVVGLSESLVALSVAKCSFHGNEVVGNGGAIAVDGVSAADVVNCTFSNNRAIGSRASPSSTGLGGAVYAKGVQASAFKLYVENSSFSNNSADVGGAIMQSLSTANIVASNFTYNNAITGSGGAWYCDVNVGYLLVSGSFFQGNNADGNGGAIFVRSVSSASFAVSLNMTNIRCSSNSAYAGGCLCAEDSTFVNLWNVAADQNTAEYGADIQASHVTRRGTHLTSEPSYGQPNCVQLHLAGGGTSLSVPPGLNVAPLFVVVFVDILGNIVENLKSSFLIEIVAVDAEELVIAGGSVLALGDTGGGLQFSTVSFEPAADSLTNVRARLQATPSLPCLSLPSIELSFSECPPRYYRNGFGCVLCPSGEFKLDASDTEKCHGCGFGGICGDGVMAASRGFWCETEFLNDEGGTWASCKDESRLFQCSTPGCLGGSKSVPHFDPSYAVVCDDSNGYSGLLCAECKKGYFAAKNECHSCQFSWISILQATWSGLLIVGAIMFIWWTSGSSSSMTDILVFYAQTALLLRVPFALPTEIRFPSDYFPFYGIVKAFEDVVLHTFTVTLPHVLNLNISDGTIASAASCGTHLSYYVRFIFALANPVILLTILWLLYPCALLLTVIIPHIPLLAHKRAQKWVSMIAEKLQLRQFTRASLELLVFSFFPLFAAVARFFSCRYVDGHWFLNSENSIECYSLEGNPNWFFMLPLACCAAFYTVIIYPLCFFGLLSVTRFRSNWISAKSFVGYTRDRKPLLVAFEIFIWVSDTFAYLCEDIRPNRYFWPLVVVFRRMVIGVVDVWLTEGDFAVAGVVLLAVFFNLNAVTRTILVPSKNRVINVFEENVLIFLSIGAIMSVLYRIMELYEDPASDIHYRGIVVACRALFWPVMVFPVFSIALNWAWGRCNLIRLNLLSQISSDKSSEVEVSHLAGSEDELQQHSLQQPLLDPDMEVLVGAEL